MKVVIAVFTGLLIMVLTYSLMPELDLLSQSDNVTPAMKNMIGLMPILMAVAAIVFVFAGVMGVDTAIKYKRWNDFGNRLKIAYAAKFGGENSGFNNEVDQHIAVMRALGKGASKSLSEDWLKRMASFVEIPYIIPEEENWTEEEKTRQFGEEE